MDVEMENLEFIGFPKMARLTRAMSISEKIDGTNAQVFITELTYNSASKIIFQKDGLTMYAGSRTKWITPEDDNAGFARWCKANAEELMQLGTGQHFGEWWGQGIQRNYGLKEKRFSLFNTHRWTDSRPACCGVVPLLYEGLFDTKMIELTLEALRVEGSRAAKGFMNPEGIIVFHTAAGIGFKKTLDKDDMPKSLAG